MGLIVDSFISILTSLAAFPKKVVSLMGVGTNVLTSCHYLKVLLLIL
jgi:hypothetical protein